MSAVPVPARTGAHKRSSPLGRLQSDERLLERLRAGDDRAFEAIYDRHHARVLSFARHMLGSREDAEDVVQHTFAAAYRSLRRSDREVALRPWLLAVARNASISLLRARRPQTPLDAVEPRTEGLTAQVMDRADLRALLVDLERLPEEQRAALILSQLGGVTHAEIGEILECPTVKVRALVFQARETLAAREQARAVPCAEIREALANDSAAHRRRLVRNHLDDCAGCREFADAVRSQRRALAVLLPIIPTIGLKETVLGAVGIGGGSGGGLLAALGAGGAAKGAAVVLATGATVVGGGVALQGGDGDSRRSASDPRGARVAPSAKSEPIATGTTVPLDQDDVGRTRSDRRRSPAAGGNGRAGAPRRPIAGGAPGRPADPGAHGRANALERGPGRQLGLIKPRPTRRSATRPQTPARVPPPRRRTSVPRRAAPATPLTERATPARPVAPGDRSRRPADEAD